MDYALSFHVGLMARINARQHSNATDEDIWKVPKTFRQLEQTHESLSTAKEAEDFQSTGVRCRELLTTFVVELQKRGFEIQDVKKGDVKNYLGLISKKLASGNSMRKIRAHLKNSIDDTWELVGWLTHHKNASRGDAEYVLEATQQLLLNVMTIVNRKEKPKPERCPICKSYQVIHDFRKELVNQTEPPYVKLCESCGWEEDKSE